MFRTSLTEKTKLEIARLYQTTDIPIEAIATQLNVSVSSVHRFKDYGYSTKDESKDQPQNQPQVIYPEKKQDFEKNQNKELCLDDRNKHYSDDKIVFIGGKKHQGGKQDISNKEEKEEKTKYQWECPKCGHEWDGSPDKCPKCGAELQE